MEASGRPTPPPNLHEVPYDDKWELLKPILEYLFIQENKKVTEIARTMDADYRFMAYPAQYTYRFKKWNWKKNIPTQKKRAMLDQTEARSVLGKRTALEYNGRPVDTNKLHRMVKQDNKRDIALNPRDDSRRTMQLLFPEFSSQFKPGIFINWNIPFGALGLLKPRETNHDSPRETATSTPSDVNAFTPDSNNIFSPSNAPSPSSRALASKTSVERAHMFAEGRFDDLVRSLNKEEGAIMSMWLYQFWLFSFKTAKYWGLGPRFWNADLLGFLDYVPSNCNLGSLPTTPDTRMSQLPRLSTPCNLENTDQIADGGQAIQRPSPLCKWSIHYRCDMEYEYLPDPILEFDAAKDERLFTPWPDKTLTEPPFQDRLVNGLASNDFSNIPADTLPIAVPQIITATKRSHQELLKEAFAFSIMSRNEDLVSEQIDRIIKAKVDVCDLHPLHLATSYLDGATSCCNILDILLYSFLWRQSLQQRRQLLVNDSGHTIFDNLMLAILKAHTSTQPGEVNNNLRNEHVFVGEEVDICGRWDADSECFRSLLAQGKSRIPFSWKHKFCHTSIQTICHCIRSVALSRGDTFRAPSGLFLNYCLTCGLRMQLTPYHTLIMTACQLASAGCPDEDLFGIIACFLSLLSNHVDPRISAEISVQTLFGKEVDDLYADGQCTHEALTPAGLANRVPPHLIRAWPRETQVGWQIFRLLLSTASGLEVEDQWDEELLAPCDCWEDYSDSHGGRFLPLIFQSQKNLGVLQAAVQAELLTYRRLSLGDPWISENFNLSTAFEILKNKAPVTSIGFIRKDLLKPFCCCGSFLPRTSDEAYEAKDACRKYCSNMDDWARTKFIPYPSTMWD